MNPQSYSLCLSYACRLISNLGFSSYSAEILGIKGKTALLSRPLLSDVTQLKAHKEGMGPVGRSVLICNQVSFQQKIAFCPFSELRSKAWIQQKWSTLAPSRTEPGKWRLQSVPLTEKGLWVTFIKTLMDGVRAQTAMPFITWVSEPKERSHWIEVAGVYRGATDNGRADGAEIVSYCLSWNGWEAVQENTLHSEGRERHLSANTDGTSDLGSYNKS